jgi:hypothetical protein
VPEVDLAIPAFVVTCTMTHEEAPLARITGSSKLLNWSPSRLPVRCYSVARASADSHE